MKLILHPGHPKCGSTSIQKWLGHNFEELDKAGIAIPGPQFRLRGLDNKKEPVSNYKYFRKLVSESQTNRFANDLDDYLNKISAHTVIISEEFLVDPLIINNENGFHQIIKQRFNSFKIVYYIRRQDDYMLSAWQQWLHKTGISLEKLTRNFIEKKNPDYVRNISFLENIYGRENITVRPFDRFFFPEQDLIRDFSDSIGLDYDSYQPVDTKSNVSLNPYLCEIFSLVSKELYDNNFDNQDVLKFLQKETQSELINATHKEYMTNSLRSEVMDFFKEDNLTLKENYFSNYNFNDLFGEKNFDVERNDLEGLKMNAALQFELIFKLNKKLELEKKGRDRYRLLKKIFNKIR